MKQVFVSMGLDSVDKETQGTKKVLSKYMVNVRVEGIIDDGLGTTCNYVKSVKFLMEPTTKKIRI